MGDRNDVLSDDWAVVEIFSNVVARRPNDFNASTKSRVIRASPRESGKERVVNVDDLIGESFREFSAENLHVARENDSIDVLLFKELDLFAFGFGFVVARDGNKVKGDAEAIGGIAQLLVIADHSSNVHA